MNNWLAVCFMIFCHHKLCCYLQQQKMFFFTFDDIRNDHSIYDLDNCFLPNKYFGMVFFQIEDVSHYVYNNSTQIIVIMSIY